MAGKLVLAVGSSLQNCLSVLTMGYVPVCVSAQWGMCPCVWPHSGVCARVCALTVGYVPVCVSLQLGGLFPSEGAIR